MQNQWFRDPDNVREMYERNPERRNRYIKKFLFMGCLSGKRLERAFGELCDSIVWEEASPEIGGQSSALFRADHAHIQQAIEQHKPDIILAFGKEASEAIKKLWSGKVVYCPHPASRFADIELRLRNGARELRQMVKHTSKASASALSQGFEGKSSVLHPSPPEFPLREISEEMTDD
jgi:hypothetical protein